MFIGFYNKSVILTYLGVASALSGMFFAFDNNFQYAMLCLLFSGICDLFDGTFARKCKNRTEAEKEFGIQIDSLADMVDFAALPAVILLCIGTKQWYHIVISSLYVCAAITRLAFFNLIVLENNKDKPVNHYQGLPVTVSAMIFPAAFFLQQVMSDKSFNIMFSLLYLVVALLFVLNIKIYKPKGFAIALLGIVGIITIVSIILWC